MSDIGDRRELFVDRFLIEDMPGTALKLHEPRPQNIVCYHDRPWEGPTSVYHTVFQDGDSYRMYYRGGELAGQGSLLCYMESDDGVDWHRPELGLVDFEGSKQNNILLCAPNIAPFIDRNPAAAESERYKALIPCGTDTKPGTITLLAYSSADGIHWQTMQEEPVLTKGAFDSLNVAFWSEHEGCYLSYFRVYSKSRDWRSFIGRRTIARAKSDDFINWSEPELMSFGDTPTEQLYTNGTHPYCRAPHIYISLAKRYVLGRDTPLTKQQLDEYQIPEGQRFISDGVFMSSRGGNVYDRTFMEAFFRPGPDPGNWSSRNNMAAWGVVQTSPVELSLYYSQHYSQPSNYLLRTTLRLDGFVSVNAGYAGGELITKPFIFEGSELELNMATSGVGSIKVEIQDAEGKPLRDYGIDDSYDLYGDDVAKIVRWHGSSDVSILSGKPVRLRFTMKDADLYAIKFNK